MLLLLCPHRKNRMRQVEDDDDFDMANYIKRSSTILIQKALTTPLTEEYLDWLVGEWPPL